MVDNNLKTIVFVNQYSTTTKVGLGGRHFYLGNELSKMGHTVYLVAGSYSHLQHSSPELLDDFLVEKINDKFSFIWLKLPKYEHAHSKMRIINEFIFSRKLKAIPDIINKKPDVVIHSSPSLISQFGSNWVAKYYKCPFVFEVRDPWPLTLTEIGGYSKKHPFIVYMQWVENQAYKNADYVFANFFNAVEHMVSCGMDKNKFTWLPNGISIDELKNKHALGQKERVQVPNDKFIVGYTGTLGEANAMSYLIDTADILSSYPDIHFVIVGNGKNKKSLIDYSRSLNLKNITFIDPIPKTQVQSMLELFDVCYIGWNKNRMYRLGVAANKIPEYMYSAKPIIHSYSGAGDLIKQAGSGISVPAENAQEVADAILKLKSLSSTEREAMGKRGKDFITENFTYEKIAKKLLATLFKD